MRRSIPSELLIADGPPCSTCPKGVDPSMGSTASTEAAKKPARAVRREVDARVPSR
jgi:hypothetical protein